MKLMSPLRSTRAIFTFEVFSSSASSRKSSSRSCSEIPSHRCQNQIAVFDDHLRPAFEKATEPVRVIGDQREQSMHYDDHNAATDGCEKRRATIDRARQDRRQDNNEHRIKRRLAGERALMPDSNHSQGREENDDPAKRDL